MGMFAERMASIIGPTYIASFFLGAAIGLTKVPPPKARRTTRLLINNYLNNIGKTSASFGNNVGGAVLMYLIIGKTINHLMKEELEEFNLGENARSALYGAITGCLYKSTRGLRPMIFASVLGAGVGTFYSYAWTKGFLNVGLKNM